MECSLRQELEPQGVLCLNITVEEEVKPEKVDKTDDQPAAEEPVEESKPVEEEKQGDEPPKEDS